MSELHEHRRDCFDEWSRAAHERQRELVGGDLREELTVDTAAVAFPTRRLLDA